jgi:hypothetical protein
VWADPQEEAKELAMGTARSALLSSSFLIINDRAYPWDLLSPIPLGSGKGKDRSRVSTTSQLYKHVSTCV